MSNIVRTRFAPSPTGFQHIGGFRTALWAWLLAKQNNGQFLLRLEDTDQERRVPGAVKYLIESLDWLGINYDEGPTQSELEVISDSCNLAPITSGPYAPYVQSLRKEHYKKAADQLVEQGVAYRCDCTAEQLAEERKFQEANKLPPGYSGRCRNRNVSKDSKHVVRIIIPDGRKFVLNDLIRGEVVWDNPSLKDTVLLKSDGMPTYHLAVVVDDNAMQISHVIRGEEWLSSYPIHLLVYEGLGFKQPQFAHVSLILGPDGKKLSKRHGAESLDYFKNQGFLPDAIVNYMVRIGWSLADGDEQEIFTRSELIEKFSMSRLSKSGGVFDMEKLLWMNAQYIKMLSIEQFTNLARPFIEQANLKFINERWQLLVGDIQSRCRTLLDAVTVAGFLFQEKIVFDTKDIYKKDMNKDVATKIVAAGLELVSTIQSFDKDTLEQAFRDLSAKLEIKPGSLFQVIRLVMTGSLVSPPLFESIVALGRVEALKRLEQARSSL